MTRRAGILGLGRRGGSWVRTCLAAGWQVSGFDPEPRAGPRLDAGDAWYRAETISAAVQDAELVIACLPERLELMRMVLQRAQAEAPGAVLAVASRQFDAPAIQLCALQAGRVLRLAREAGGQVVLEVSARNGDEFRDDARAYFIELQPLNAKLQPLLREAHSGRDATKP